MPMPLILFTSTWMYYKESRPIRGGFFMFPPKIMI